MKYENCINLSELPMDTKICVDGSGVITVAEFMEDLDGYIDSEILTTVYTVEEVQVNLNAKKILDYIIEETYETMYEGWDEKIRKDITEKDINDIQEVLDRILERHLGTHINFITDKIVILDTLE